MESNKKKRVYVMDFGDFIKIGVSSDVERRKYQVLPNVKRYFATEPILNAFEIEKFMHRVFTPAKNKEIGGKEYFTIGFEVACKLLQKALTCPKNQRDEIEDAVIDLRCENPKFTRYNDKFYSLIEKTMNIKKSEAVCWLFAVEGILARNEIKELEQKE